MLDSVIQRKINIENLNGITISVPCDDYALLSQLFCHVCKECWLLSARIFDLLNPQKLAAKNIMLMAFDSSSIFDQVR